MEDSLGVAAIRHGRHDDGLGLSGIYSAFPAGRLTIGGHPGGIDFGLGIDVPSAGLGLYFGFDFAHW